MSQVFAFQDHPVRTIIENGQPWFAGSDIAKLLGYVRPEKEVRRICKHVKLFKPTNLVGWGNSPRGFLIIPEADVWRLIVHSTLPKAQEVEEWIMSEVLPAIRKTGRYEAKPKALPKPKQKALPPAPQPSYREKCAAITARMPALRGDLFRVSQEMMCVFRDPFWGPAGVIPEDKKPFADAMNYAIQSFYMAVNKNLEAMELLFNAYVEGEKVLNG